MVGNRETALRNLAKAGAKVAQIVEREQKPAQESNASVMPLQAPEVTVTVPEKAIEPIETPHKAHLVKSWQPTCPECGETNPYFKDETICADCSRHLGSKESALELPACPYCGGHRLKSKKSTVHQELRRKPEHIVGFWR